MTPGELVGAHEVPVTWGQRTVDLRAPFLLVSTSTARTVDWGVLILHDMLSSGSSALARGREETGCK